MLCKDCVQCCDELYAAGVAYEFLDFKDALMNLKEFLIPMLLQYATQEMLLLIIPSAEVVTIYLMLRLPVAEMLMIHR